MDSNEVSQVEIPKEVKHRKPKKLPVYVSSDDLLAIMKVAKHKHHKFAYLMAWYSGLRISEVLKLEPRDIDMKKGTKYLLIDGERRFKAISILAKQDKDYQIVDCIVIKPKNKVILQLVSDIHKQKLPHLEEGEAYKRLIEEVIK